MDGQSNLPEGARLSGAPVPTADLPVAGEDELRTGVRQSAAGREAERHEGERNAELDRRLAAERERHGKEAMRERVLAHLTGLAAGQPGGDLRAVKARADIQALQLQIHQGELGKQVEDGTTKDERWFLDRGQSIIRTSFEAAQRIAVDERDVPGAGVPSLSGTGRRRGQRFDLDRMLGGMMRTLTRDKARITHLDELTGSDEAQWCKAQASKPLVADLIRRARVNAPPGSLSIPVPVESLDEMAFGRPDETPEAAAQRLAENYSMQDDIAEPDFARALLVPFPRPVDQRPWLGVMMMRLDNLLTVPSLTDSHVAAFLGENDEIPTDSMTIGNVTTAPHRLGARDDFSWMLEVSQGGFGIRSLGLAEMMRAMVEKEEEVTYVGTGTGDNPRGVWNHTGINTKDLAKALNTLAGWLTVPEVLDEKKISSGRGAFVTTIRMKNRFKVLLDYAGTSGALPLWRSAGASPMTGLAGASVEELDAHRGILLDSYRAVATTQMPKTATTTEALTGGQLNATLFKLWNYVIGFVFGTAILTIDDISQAATGQTRAVINKYCDVLDRYPDSGVRVAADHTP